MSEVGVDAVVGGYRLLEVIGEGGTGAVYHARHEEDGREVAVRVIREAGAPIPELVSGLLGGSRRLSQLHHLNIVDLISAGYDPETKTLFVVHPLLRGKLLSDYIQDQKISVRDVVSVMDPIMVALAYSHRRKVAHRALKPDRIFLHKEGTLLTPKLLGLGLAELLRLEPDPAYHAPEQLAGGPVGPPADVWAVATMFYRLSTGAAPPPAGEEGDPSFPQSLRRWIDRARDPDPGRRPTIQVLAAGLREAVDREAAVANGNPLDDAATIMDPGYGSSFSAGGPSPWGGDQMRGSSGSIELPPGQEDEHNTVLNDASVEFPPERYPAQAETVLKINKKKKPKVRSRTLLLVVIILAAIVLTLMVGTMTFLIARS